MRKNNDILIEAKGVSKKFSRSLNKSLWYGMKDIVGSVTGMRSNQSELRKDEFWAVRDINFTLRRGECLGLIGRNGAGKSTLLKMLNGLIRPDEGSITMRGKIGALIELGAGFNPLLSGRENIYVNGQLLGFSKKEMDAKLPDILDFAEIDEFIDSPVQNYSSGMKVRLGFAVAAQMEPDVLLIDEVLAVGDVGFQVKCFNAIQKIGSNSCVIFVSHSMPNIARITNKVLQLDKGNVVYYGENINIAINLYLNNFKGEDFIVTGKNVKLYNLNIYDRISKELNKINAFHDLEIQFEISTFEFESGEYIIVYVFFDKTLRQIASHTTEIVNLSADDRPRRIFSQLNNINLAGGIYNVGIAIYKLNNGKLEIFTYQKNIATLIVVSKANITNTVVEFEGSTTIKEN